MKFGKTHVRLYKACNFIHDLNSYGLLFEL